MSQLTAKDLRKLPLKLIASEEITVTTAGTPVNPTSNTSAVVVRVINNNESVLVACGMQAAEVDATTSPKKGVVLGLGQYEPFPVVDDASEVEVDAELDGTEVSIQIWGKS